MSAPLEDARLLTYRYQRIRQDIESDLFVLQWMYIIPLGLIVMNVVTAAANIPEEAAGQGQPGAERAPAAAAGRRR